MARIAQVGTLNVKRSCKDQMEPKTSFEEKQREGRAVSSVSPEQARWEVGSRAPPTLGLGAAPACEEEVRAGGSLELLVLWRLWELQLQKNVCKPH